MLGKHYIQLILLCLLSCFGWNSSHASVSDERAVLDERTLLLFDGSAANPSKAVRFVEEVLWRVYTKLGYRVKYQRMPIARSFIEANEGRIDGLRARIEQAAAIYPDLVKVNYPLFDFNLVVVARRSHCGICPLEDFNRVATVRGFVALGTYLNEHPPQFEVVSQAEPEEALRLLQHHEVDAVILGDAMFREEQYRQSDEWIVYRLVSFADYHWLNKQHEGLARLAEQELQRMELSGELDRLRDKYSIERYLSTENLNSDTNVTLVTSQRAAIESRSSHRYAPALQRVYAPLGVSLSYQDRISARLAFSQRDFDIWLGAFRMDVPTDAILADTHIDMKPALAAIGKDRLALEEQLYHGKPGTACFRAEDSPEYWLPANLTHYTIDDLSRCYELLKSGRVDLVVDFDALELTPARDKRLSQIRIRDKTPLYAVFHDTDRGHRLRHIFETEFRQLSKVEQVTAINSLR